MSDLAQERQQQRLRYIDLCAYVLGFVNRKLLMNRFDVKEAWATKDFSAYQSISGDRLVYDHALRGYKPVDWFTPLFEHNSTNALQLLSEGSQTIVCEQFFAKNSYSYAIKTVEPKLDAIYNLLRAIHLGKKAEIEYISRSSGKQTRLIVPHTIIRTGSFQYARAYDHKTGEFRSFKLNRVVHSKLVTARPTVQQKQEADKDWNTDVRLSITVNKKLENKEAIAYDFGLINDKLTIDIKKAMINYFLMDWNIAPLEFPDLPPLLFPLQLTSISELPNT